MNLDNKIKNFIDEMGYLNNEHVLGILFYGSYLTGFNNKNSDIDLHIIFDNDDKKHLVRGNKIIDDIRIEYFEKPIEEIYQIVEDDYNTQNNASVSIFGKSKIIYAKDEQIKRLQEYVNSKFSNPLPPLSENEAKEQVAIINNRMEKLKQYALEDSPCFEHLYHLTIEKIRRFYHNLMGMPRIETTKGFRLYVDEEYRKSFYISDIPEKTFLNMYFKTILSNDLDKNYKYTLIERLYEYSKRNVDLNVSEHRIPIKSKNIGLDMPVIEPYIIEDIKSITIPPLVLKKILKFIKEMDYLNNKHVLGMIVFGSSLTGHNTVNSDIDLRVVFDNNEPNRLIRGVKTIDGTKIEYFEKPLNDMYLTIENEYANQNNASYSIIAKGTIVFDRNDSIKKLQQYAINRFKNPLPPLSEDEAKEQKAIINNKLIKLEQYALEDSPYFEHLYHLVIGKIRKVYHRISGISKFPTSKVYKIYTDDEYRKSTYKENPEQEFVDMYIELITNNCNNKFEKLQNLRTFYDYSMRNINLNNEYKISIKKRKINI